jgi:hypothetical protein
MPTCPIETSEEGDAEWKEYQPRIEPDGRSFQDELVTIKGTRKQLMERLAKLFADWSPHDWIDRWNTHARHLTYVPLCTPLLALPPSLCAAQVQATGRALWLFGPPSAWLKALERLLAMGFTIAVQSASGRGVRAAGVFCCCVYRSLSMTKQQPQPSDIYYMHVQPTAPRHIHVLQVRDV